MAIIEIDCDHNLSEEQIKRLIADRIGNDELIGVQAPQKPNVWLAHVGRSS